MWRAVTFEECRTHLGLETQRQWNDQAIARTTPALPGLFSWVVLLAHHLCGDDLPVRSTAWYTKSQAAFVDGLAFVRLYLAQHLKSPTPRSKPRLVEFPVSVLERLMDTLAHAG